MEKKVSLKVFVCVVALAVLLSVTSTYALVQFNFWLHHNPGAKYNVYFWKQESGKTGAWVEVASGNVLTQRIERKVRNVFTYNNETIHVWQVIGLGNSSISSSKNKLDMEATIAGFNRSSGTVVGWTNSGGHYCENVTHKFTATANIEVNSTELVETTTVNTADAVALASLGSLQSFQNTWNCTIRWVLTYAYWS
jgi:hypothetical protein